MRSVQSYKAVWFIDFEFSSPTGGCPIPVCMVARELFSNRVIRLNERELKKLKVCPIPVDEHTLFVAYYSPAEWDCFLALGWPLPKRILDLFVEFKNIYNGRSTLSGLSLLGALMQFGLDAIAVSEKEEMRALAMRGGPYTKVEMEALLDYCQTDVDALVSLFRKMIDLVDLPRAIFRGRCMAAVSRMQQQGVPVDVPMLELIRSKWLGIKYRLIEEVDSEYGIYEGTTFKRGRFEEWTAKNHIPWPRTQTDQPKLDSNTFRQLARQYPRVAPIHELRQSLSCLKLEKLSVGTDGRNRCMLSPFSSITSRNQPSNAKFIFGPSTWIRGLIKPDPGKAVAYIDWSQQELGIAAGLSGDTRMQAAYTSGDPYLAFAKQAGAVPPNATKQSHPEQRATYKICALGVQYGLTKYGLSENLGKPLEFADDLLKLHRETYPVFWQWSEQNVCSAQLQGWIQTVFGWRINTNRNTKPSTLANFPCQANGAEMLRLACCLATENGISVCCPVHDAILIEGPIDEIDSIVAQTQAYMAEASRIVLDGFELATDVEIVRYPDRYMDPRGEVMWNKVMDLCERTQ